MAIAHSDLSNFPHPNLRNVQFLFLPNPSTTKNNLPAHHQPSWQPRTNSNCTSTQPAHEDCLFDAREEMCTAREFSYGAPKRMARSAYFRVHGHKSLPTEIIFGARGGAHVNHFITAHAGGAQEEQNALHHATPRHLGTFRDSLLSPLHRKILQEGMSQCMVAEFGPWRPLAWCAEIISLQPCAQSILSLSGCRI